MLTYVTYHGQNNFIIDADDSWIFRFPKHEAAAEDLRQEYMLLTSITPFIQSCSIPQPVLYDNETEGPVYAVYKKIHGTSMSRQLFDGLTPPEQIALAQKIAAFLQELHSIPSSVFSEAAIPLSVNGREYWQDFLSRLEIHVFPHIRPDVVSHIYADFQQFLNDPANFQFTPVLIHGDLGAVNIIYDSDIDGGRQVSGVIDFGQACLGDPAVDIASLICPRSFGGSFADLLRQAWVVDSEDSTDFDKLLARARFYISTFALQDALFGAEHGDEEAFQDGITTINQ